jgi:hypothetical protein
VGLKDGFGGRVVSWQPPSSSARIAQRIRSNKQQHTTTQQHYTMAAPTPQTFPYDYLFKVLIIGDASVGKVREDDSMGRDAVIPSIILHSHSSFFCLAGSSCNTEFHAAPVHGRFVRRAHSKYNWGGL